MRHGHSGRKLQRKSGHRAALLRLGEWVAEFGVDADDLSWRAGRDLLLQLPPRCGQPAGAPLRHDDETAFGGH